MHDDADDVRIYQNTVKMHSALLDIYNMVRTELKHGDEELSDHNS